MVFWRWFSSEKKMQELLKQSVGYDISPVIVHPPANTNEAVDTAGTPGVRDGGNTALKKRRQ